MDQTIDIARAHREVETLTAAPTSGQAVAAGAPCEHCTVPIGDTYFTVNGHATCPKCEADLGGSLRVALALGLGAALLNVAAYHAIYWLLHMRFALVSVTAGVLIGEAVRRGAKASKSLGYRWLAVTLTYLTAVTTYALALMDSTGSDNPAATMLRSLVLPFVMLAARENIVTLILLGFGLHEAWKFSAPPYAHIEGPFKTSTT
ncbi:MAG TPA: hypothetical protein VF331_22030 [Polyangiales bacterium]